MLNEVMHPEADSLFNVIAQGNDPDTYAALVRWQYAKGLTDEEAGDLYAYIEDAFEAKPFGTISKSNAVSMISACLWANERIQ